MEHPRDAKRRARESVRICNVFGTNEERTSSSSKRVPTDEVGDSRRRAHMTGERETAKASGNTVAHSSRSFVESIEGSKRRASA